MRVPFGQRPMVVQQLFLRPSIGMSVYPYDMDLEPLGAPIFGNLA